MVKNAYILIVIIGTVAIFAAGCYYDNEESLYPAVNNQCDTANVTYSKTVSGILSSYCYGCHGSTYQSTGGGNKLDTYNDVVANIDRVIGAINHNSGYVAMPQGSAKLGDCLIRQIEIWKSNGSPNN